MSYIVCGCVLRASGDNKTPWSLPSLGQKNNKKPVFYNKKHVFVFYIKNMFLVSSGPRCILCALYMIIAKPAAVFSQDIFICSYFRLSTVPGQGAPSQLTSMANPAFGGPQVACALLWSFFRNYFEQAHENVWHG